MKKYTYILKCVVLLVFVYTNTFAQAPQKLSYQSVIFDNQNALVRNTAIGLRISFLQGSSTGNIVYQETFIPNPVTNGNGVVMVEIGNGTPSIGAFEMIDWAQGPYFIMSETDLTGGMNYSLSGISQVMSTPYALYSNKSADGFSGDYNDLTNKPLMDGTETKLQAGNQIGITGTGSSADPYIISATTPLNNFFTPLVLISSQNFTVPQGVSKIKVELWGGAGGGGGAGTYSYSYDFIDGGPGGAGGYACQFFDVTAGQQFDVTVGNGGAAGVNASMVGGYLVGDTDGGDGGDTFFASMKAAGGTGGKRGSFGPNTVFGLPGTDNIGTITGHASGGGSNFLDVYTGIPRSYIAERKMTSLPGKGGSIYYIMIPSGGEGGCAVITFLDW